MKKVQMKFFRLRHLSSAFIRQEVLIYVQVVYWVHWILTKLSSVCNNFPGTCLVWLKFTTCPMMSEILTALGQSVVVYLIWDKSVK